MPLDEIDNIEILDETLCHCSASQEIKLIQKFHVHDEMKIIKNEYEKLIEDKKRLVDQIGKEKSNINNDRKISLTLLHISDLDNIKKKYICHLYNNLPIDNFTNLSFYIYLLNKIKLEVHESILKNNNNDLIKERILKSNDLKIMQFRKFNQNPECTIEFIVPVNSFFIFGGLIPFYKTYIEESMNSNAFEKIKDGDSNELIQIINHKNGYISTCYTGLCVIPSMPKPVSRITEIYINQYELLSSFTIKVFNQLKKFTKCYQTQNFLNLYFSNPKYYLNLEIIYTKKIFNNKLKIHTLYNTVANYINTEINQGNSFNLSTINSKLVDKYNYKVLYDYELKDNRNFTNTYQLISKHIIKLDNNNVQSTVLYTTQGNKTRYYLNEDISEKIKDQIYKLLQMDLNTTCLFSMSFTVNKKSNE